MVELLRVNGLKLNPDMTEMLIDLFNCTCPPVVATQNPLFCAAGSTHRVQVLLPCLPVPSHLVLACLCVKLVSCLERKVLIGSFCVHCHRKKHSVSATRSDDGHYVSGQNEVMLGKIFFPLCLVYRA